MSLKELRRRLRPAGEIEPFEPMVAKVVERRESADVPRAPRVVNLALDLFRNEVMRATRAFSLAVVVEIVDETWLPPLRSKGGR